MMSEGSTSAHAQCVKVTSQHGDAGLIVQIEKCLMSLTLSGGVLQRTASASSGEFSLNFSVFSVKCSSLEFIF